MMKVNFAYWGLLMVVTGLVACTSTDSDYQDICPEENIKSVKVIARNFEKADGISRTSVTIKNEEPVFSWAENDTIGIFPATGYQVAFPMQSGAGAQVAEFDGGGWALRSTSQYAAYYPYQSENRSRENIYVSYLGQLQNGNKNTQHLGDYDYMAAALAVPEDDHVTFDFKHLGVLLECRLKIASKRTLTFLTVQSDESVLMMNGKLSLKNRKPILEPVELGKELTVSLSGITVSSASQEIIVYMMLKIIISTCPKGFPFAQKISEVTPIREAVRESGEEDEESIYAAIIVVTEKPHRSSSVLLKYEVILIFY